MTQVWTVLAVIVLGWLGLRMLIVRSVEVRKLRRCARDLRLNYAFRDVVGVQSRYRNLALIREGHNRHACHVLYGMLPEGFVTAFRYSYDLGFGSDRQHLSQWMAIIEAEAPGELPASADLPPDAVCERQSRLFAIAHPDTGDETLVTRLIEALRAGLKNAADVT